MTTKAITSKALAQTSNINLDDGISIDNICLNDDYGYMAHPKDCRKYFYCQEGTAKVFTCQGGLLWKQSDGNCVWPLDSDCNLYFKQFIIFLI